MKTKRIRCCSRTSLCEGLHKGLLLLLLWVSPFIAHAQVQPDGFLWVQTGGGPTIDSGASVTVDPSTNAIVLGVYSNTAFFSGQSLTNAGLTDIFLAKYRSDGTLAWLQRAGSVQEDGASGVACDTNGNIFATGFFRGQASFGPAVLQTRGSPSSLDAFLCKYDPSGKLLWAQQGGGINDDRGYGVAVDLAGNCYWVGSFQGDATFGLNTVLHGTNTLVLETFVAKYASDGSLKWAKRCAASRGVIGYAIAVDNSTNTYVTGEFVGAAVVGMTNLVSTGDRDAFVLKLGPNGETLWATHVGGALTDGGRGIGVDVEGNAIVTGYFNDQATFGAVTAQSGGGRDLFVARFKTDGSLDWVRTAGGALDDVGTGVAVTPAGIAYVSGWFTVSMKIASTVLTSAGAADAFLARYGADGTLQWLARGGGGGIAADSGNAVAVGGGGDVFLVGEFSGDADFGTNTVSTSSKVNRDFFLARRSTAAPPALSQFPTNATAVVGTTASFVVIANTLGVYAYQWFHDGISIPGATNASLIVDPVLVASAGQYQVSVSGAESSVLTPPAELEVRCLLTVTQVGLGEVFWDPALPTYPLGSKVQFISVAQTESFFVNWSGDLISTDNPVTLTLDGNKAVVAVFASRILTTSVQMQGTVERNPDKPLYDPGDIVTLTARPSQFFAFLSWSDGVTSNPRTIQIGPSNSYTAVFTNTVPVETITIGDVSRTAPVGTPALLVDGQFVTSGPRSWGDSVQLTLRTSFTNGVIVYSLDGAPPARQYQLPLKLTSSVRVRAAAYSDDFSTLAEMNPVDLEIFRTFQLTVANTGGGSLRVDPAKIRYLSNDVVTLTARPTNNWMFLGWAGDASGNSATQSVTMDGNRCVQAVFGTALSMSTIGAGRIEAQPAMAFYPYGSTVRFTALPSAGSNFVAWSGAFSGESNPQTLDVIKPLPLVRGLFLSSGSGFSLVVREKGGGSVLVFPRLNLYTNGQSVVLIASAGPRQSFQGWSGDAQDTTNRITVKILKPTLIEATFSLAPSLVMTNCGGFESSADLRLQVSSELGSVLDLQRSRGLVEWVSWRTVTNVLGRLLVQDPVSGGSDADFYRALQLPRMD